MNAENHPSQPKELTPEEAYEKMSQETVAILDVRDAPEYYSGHIPGAMLLPLRSISARAEKMLPDKNATILVYCQSGRRSAQAAAQLCQMGYTQIYDFGGIVDWPYDTQL